MHKIVVRLILQQQHYILMLKKDKREGGGFGLIGGQVEEGESVLQAIIREAEEEAGILLLPDQLRMVHVMHRNKKKQSIITFYFHAERWGGIISNKQPQLHEFLAWYPIQQLPSETLPTTKHAIESALSGDVFSTYNWDKSYSSNNF